jgi:hypothetical protein
MKVASLLILVIIITGCAPRYMNKNISQEQEKQDHLDCKFEASKVGGYDWIDKASNQSNVMKACLEAKGYTRGGK